MNIYQKLSKARLAIQKKELKKSGRNAFSKYDYFELKDFLPEVNILFNELGLCGVVSFTDKLATLTLYDSESEGKIEFTSPMEKASLKGCHDIQNLGAVETYQRRYLYMTALEIVEYDVLDENTGNENVSPKQKHQNNNQSQFDPNETLTNYNKAMKNANDLETIERYWKSVNEKLLNYPDQLAKAKDYYEYKKEEIKNKE